MKKKFGLSERRACRAIGQPRSTQRYLGRKPERDLPLLERMAALSRENPRYDYRRVWALLKREGWAVNRKRVQRLWREADLKVPVKKEMRKRRQMGDSENATTRKRADHVNRGPRP